MDFFQEVYTTTRRIPKGRVATYGQIAGIISSPRAARIVGFALRRLPDNTDVPWHRVINQQGMISIENLEFPKEVQAQLLRREGVFVEERKGNFFVDLSAYLWQP